MSALSILAASLGAAFVGSEVVLRGTKLQTGLTRVLAWWALVYAGVIALLLAQQQISPVAFTILWGGVFLSWFGVRSHIESSILLRMLVLLRQQPLTEAQLVARYTSRFGEAVRLDELCRGGFAEHVRGTVSVTRKGQRILRAVAALR